MVGKGKKARITTHVDSILALIEQEEPGKLRRGSEILIPDDRGISSEQNYQCARSELYHPRIC